MNDCTTMQHTADDTPPVDDGPDDNWGGFRRPVRHGHITIEQPRLIKDRTVHLRTGSTVELVKFDGYDDTYWSLLVDGRYYPLVMAKFMHGRPEIETSLQAALAQVQAAIAALADDVPTDNPDQDTTPDTEGPSPMRRPRCTACDTADYVMSSTIPGLCLGCSNARYWGFASRLEAEPHAWMLPVPILYCSGCLCVAEQLDANAWRCRNPQCLSVWPRDELLTTSELIKRRAALERIRVAVMARVLCTNCGGFHSVQKCPELWSELRADPTLGAQLMGLWWKKHTSFVAMLINADAARRRHYAYSWVAYIRTYNPATELTAYRMLARWAHEMDPEPIVMEMAA
jgi:hypothetical protein